MIKTLTLLIATTALTTGIGIPSWGAMHGAAPAVVRPSPAVSVSGDSGARLIMVDDDADEYGSAGSASESKDSAGQGTDKSGESDCEEDEGSCGAATNPAPAGTVAPPKNGLFGDGAAPSTKVN